MKGLYIFVALLVVAVNAEDTCSADTISECSGIGGEYHFLLTI